LGSRKCEKHGRVDPSASEDQEEQITGGEEVAVRRSAAKQCSGAVQRGLSVHRRPPSQTPKGNINFKQSYYKQLGSERSVCLHLASEKTVQHISNRLVLREESHFVEDLGKRNHPVLTTGQNLVYRTAVQFMGHEKQLQQSQTFLSTNFLGEETVPLRRLLQ